MTDKVRFTYRLTDELYKKIKQSADKRNISINSEINRVLWDYYEEKKEKQEE